LAGVKVLLPGTMADHALLLAVQALGRLLLQGLLLLLGLPLR
jgi:hypothetical protein